MQSLTVSRRELLAAGGAAVASLALFNNRFAYAAPVYGVVHFRLG